jgi:hypothetical protein
VNLQLVLHLVVWETLETTQLLQGIQFQAYKTPGLYGCQIHPTAFDAEDLLFFPHNIFPSHLDGSIAPSVQNKMGIFPDQTGGVNPQSQFWRNGGMLGYKFLGFSYVKMVLHTIFLFHSEIAASSVNSENPCNGRTVTFVIADEEKQPCKLMTFIFSFFLP